MNAKHSRDRSVDELLRRALVAPATPRVSEACLDAETLAAWVDGGLDQTALALAETHAASCARCQTLAAAMVRSAPELVLRPAWWRRDWRVRWVVPLAAATAAAMLWMIVPDRPTGSPVSDQVSFQSRPQAAPPLPPAVETAPATPPQAQSSAEAKREGPTSALGRERAAVVGGAAVGQRPETEQRANASAPRSPSRPATPAPAVSAAADRRVANEAGSPPPPPTAPAPQATRGILRDEAATFGAASAAREILSPDPVIRWRIGPPGTVSFSTDGGATWELVRTGNDVELTSGSSPSPSVCWLVGRGGVILRTTDGRQFDRASFPEAVDLASIVASGAQTAVITTRDGRVFRTADAGQTWTSGRR